MASIASAVADNVTTTLAQIIGGGAAAGGAARPALIPNGTTTTLGYGLSSAAPDAGGTLAIVSTTGAANSSNATTEPPFTLPHDVWILAILGILAGIVALVTIVGNIMVLLAFGLERTIRQPTNYFLASLAVSDLLIGTFSMPLYTQYLLQGRWLLGPWLCDLWLSLDWTVCLTSQYTVFLITMDRFLSVKIPAKYRNWRTEKKVLIMIAVTWIGPACVFFTSIIGWQYFVGERKVAELQCEVQFMTDVWFTFFLTIGYYWITLFVMCILYGGIYKVALDLQRKSDAKHRKMQSTMELAGDNPAAAIRNFGGPDDGMGEGSNNNSSGGGDSNIPPPPPQSSKAKNNASKHAQNSSGGNSNRKSIKTALPCPPGAQEVNTTSFSVKKNKGRKEGVEEERSSSPAFDSDDENIATAKPGKGAQGGLVNSALFANTGGLVRSLHGDLFFNTSQAASAIVNGDSKSNSVSKPPATTTTTPVTPGTASGTTTSTATTSPNYLQPPPYSSLGFASDTASDADGSSSGVQRDVEYDSVYSSSASDHRLDKQTTPLLPKQDADQQSHRQTPNHTEIINKGRNFIDEKSFLAASLSSESAALLPAMVMNVSRPPPGKRKIATQGETDEMYEEEEDEEDDSDVADLDTASSPIWKRRTSLPPLATDVFDLEGEDDEDEDDDEDDEDDDRSDCLFITEYTTTTSVGEDFAMTPTSQQQQHPGGQALRHPADMSGDVARLGGAAGAATLPQLQRARADTANTVTSETTTYADTVTDDYSNSNSNASPAHQHFHKKGDLSAPNNLTVGFRGDVEDRKENNVGATNNSFNSIINNNNNNNSGGSASGSGSGSGSNFANTNNNPPPSETNTNEDSSRSESHCLAAVRRRRDRRKDHNRLHTFVKSVRSRNSRRRNRRERKSKSENRARKALRTISFILGAFVLCWTPYHVAIMIMAICVKCVNLYLYSFTYWMCYLNSPMNPFCYAFANAQFKRTFLRIMRFDWHRT